jgi:hypothetical protein
MSTISNMDFWNPKIWIGWLIVKIFILVFIPYTNSIYGVAWNSKALCENFPNINKWTLYNRFCVDYFFPKIEPLN